MHDPPPPGRFDKPHRESKGAKDEETLRRSRESLQLLELQALAGFGKMPRPGPRSLPSMAVDSAPRSARPQSHPALTREPVRQEALPAIPVPVDRYRRYVH